MLDYARQRHITHLLLIDKETVARMQALAHNAGELYRRFCKIAGVSAYDHYTLVIVFPELRTDLAKPAADLETEMTRLGAKCNVLAVADADMFVMRGKAGLLACSLHRIAGATLVSDVPIAVGAVGIAESILSVANNSTGVYPIGGGLHAAIICHASSIDYSLFRLPERHDLSDVLGALSVGSAVRRPAFKSNKKWWQFWR